MKRLGQEKCCAARRSRSAINKVDVRNGRTRMVASEGGEEVKGEEESREVTKRVHTDMYVCTGKLE